MASSRLVPDTIHRKAGLHGGPFEKLLAFTTNAAAAHAPHSSSFDVVVDIDQ